MSDYISRQATIKRMKELHFGCKDFHICGGILLELNALEAIPPADVRPVVFCKDCDEVGYDQDGLPFCQVWDVYITESKKTASAITGRRL